MSFGKAKAVELFLRCSWVLPGSCLTQSRFLTRERGTYMGHRGPARDSEACPGLGQRPVPGHCLKEGSRAAPHTWHHPDPTGGCHQAGTGPGAPLRAVATPGCTPRPRALHGALLLESFPAEPASVRVPGSWGACAAAEPRQGLPSPEKEAPGVPRAAEVAPAWRQAALPRQQQQIRLPALPSPAPLSRV